MGCANTKAGGTAVAEECAPEGGDAQQKDVPKVMVDGDDMAVNGNVVNANGIEESAEDAKETVACNGDLTDSKCQAKTNNEESSSKNKDATSPSGDGKSNCANEEAKMAADDDTAAGDDAQIEAADADAAATTTNNATDAAAKDSSSSTTDDKEASESRDNNAGEGDAEE